MDRAPNRSRAGKAVAPAVVPGVLFWLIVLLVFLAVMAGLVTFR